ncbi:MAG TPA: hypothetical protein VGR32_00970 [Brevundimonas sp.]|jgi:hypothetical protein|uniref:DUF6880 family protein n=1 Tax=Brevundimonas sp. TaxID=1871086 RepID=UPI002DEFF862|nr:DUF6880 family protein [Brevundimonas sp.]HEV2081002.1 hypothetical protein [Brevundimonas sp.]
MAKRATRAGKTLSAANLIAMGPDRLADLLLEAAAGDAAFKRRLRMELAAEVGAADLALEIDKRLIAIAASRARVSWRKRPGLLAELTTLRRMIAERLAPLDAAMALDRLTAWFDLYPGLAARVSDAKGELPLLFDAAAGDLAEVASTAGADVAVPILAEALSTRLGQWAAWVGRGAEALDPDVARRLLAALTQGRAPPTGRLALVVRKLADRAGDLDAWASSLSEEERARPEAAAELARRLALAGRPAEARAALEAVRRPRGSPWRKAEAETEAEFVRRADAEIAILDAEGRGDEADQVRWSLFERTLSIEQLRALIARLPDFEDVIALDRAFATAGRHPDLMRALGLLMGWPALRESAELVTARQAEIRGAHDDVPLWASRLSARHPAAALALVRARARALMAMGGMTEEVQGLVAEAEALARAVPPHDHDDFLRDLTRPPPGRPRR